MNISPDVSALAALARDISARQDKVLARDSSSWSRDAAISSSYGGNAPAIKPVLKSSAAARGADEDSQQSRDTQREAPLRQRPRYPTKGQSVNILV